jgi:hypothetical protein
MKKNLIISSLLFMATIVAYSFHEGVGLAVSALFIWHLTLNQKPEVGYVGLVGTRFSDASRINSFDAQGGGINSTGATPIPYAATISLPTPVKNALRHYYDFASLTGALTLNVAAGAFATSANGLPTSIGFQEGDEVFLRFTSTGTFAVTFGTNIRGAAGPSLTVGQFAVAHLMCMDGKLTVLAVSTPGV